ncbi:carboxylic ester hydrolase [Elysia marginata]|uniref:Carboxylic ester hydrolase n=1 Tax=Elysia marginata TaxID=1093978 RepID=A0AAV4IHF7_9GAST|nr:carboxylic ester hydrolase [Elysia marginata]
MQKSRLCHWPSGKTLAQSSGGVGSIHGRVKPRTLKLVLLADPPNVWHHGVSGYDKQASETRKPYSVYYGVPFAEPPVGGLRFSPPRPYQGRGSGSVITSNTFRPSCYQFPAEPTTVMSEDCLHLNIFSPLDASPARLKKVFEWNVCLAVGWL